MRSFVMGFNGARMSHAARDIRAEASILEAFTGFLPIPAPTTLRKAGTCAVDIFYEMKRQLCDVLIAP